MSLLERFVNRSPGSGGAYRLTSSRAEEPFLRRHFWPPSAIGTIVIALVASLVLGFLGALYYTVSESGAVQLRDPDGPVEEQPGADDPALQAPATKPTTTRPEFFSVDALAKEVAPSIWSVATLDEAGRPVEASAVAVGSFGGQSFLLTPLAVVSASTRIPGPEITVRNGGTSANATLWTWQEDRDLALLVITRDAPPLPWAGTAGAELTGQKIFVAAPGAPLAPGVVSSASPDGIQHNVFVEGARQGGALINQAGELLGMVSRDYNPGGVGTDRIFVAVPVRSACGQILACSDNQIGPAQPLPADDPSVTTTRPDSASTTTTRPRTTTTRRP